MKKFFIALSVLAALFLTVVPSQANVGPDLVPANQFVIPVVCSMDESMDTLVAIHEVGGQGSVTGTTYRLHWTLYDRSSKEIINDLISYTPYDVTTIAVGAQILFKKLNPANLTSIEADLNGDGTNDHYVAYLIIEDTTGAGTNPSNSTSNHLVANFYFANASGGMASGTPVPGWEFLTGTQYDPYQKWPSWATGAPVYTTGTTSAAGLESFSALAYATSRLREENLGDPTAASAGQSVDNWLVPRWWLYTKNGYDTKFIWKNENQTKTSTSTTVGGWTAITVYVFDNNEDSVSRTIDLSKELNIVRTRDVVPYDLIPTGTADTDQIGGWIDIPIPTSRYGHCLEIMGWNWVRSQSTDATLNWSATGEMHKEIGTLSPAI